GEGDLTAVEQASLFATLANGGVYHTPHVVTRIVEPTGELPLKIVTRPVLSTAQAADVDYALSADNIPGGTAYPQAAWPGYTVIGKTGTTQTAQDAWFIGAIPQQALAVTLFTDKQNSVSGPGEQTLDILPALPNNATGGYGGAWPAYIWHSFMTTAFAGLTAQPFGTPDYTGFSMWNQVGNLPPKRKPKQNPNPGIPGPSSSTCTQDGAVQVCQPGVSAPPQLPPVPVPSPGSPGGCVPTPVNSCGGNGAADGKSG
ncbi:MAG: penicillin-binding transpeptidase domain-containing protein, partial [Streptosporangiaceae bacterium]